MTLASAIIPLLVIMGILLPQPEQPRGSETRTPILVELFTSEGCSSCPPADRFLQQLDQQPTDGARFIVLSEHVDYWNHLGWKDPYSDPFFSKRQSVYARRLGLDSVYTPQMVVDGRTQFVGSNTRLARKAFTKRVGAPKIAIRLSEVSAMAPGTLHAHLETGELEASLGSREADVYVAVAFDRAESQVSAGENGGSRLAHTAVVRSLTKIGVLKTGQSFAQDVDLKLGPGTDLNKLRLIAFIQESRQGPVWGATFLRVSHTP